MGARDPHRQSAEVEPTEYAEPSDEAASADAAVPSAGDRVIGYAAGAVAVTIWAGWIVAARQSVASDYGVSLSAWDVALLRFGAPALLFAPIWLRSGLKPRGVPWGQVAALTCWGAPFALLFSLGAATADVVSAAALVPGMMPLWFALIAWVAYRERVEGARLVGLVCILTAAAAALTPALLGDAAQTRASLLAGAPFFAGASIAWAVFAVAFKRSGLTPLEAASVVSVYSVLLLIPLSFWFESRLAGLGWPALMTQATVHGVLGGAVSIGAYGLAIEKLGAAAATSLSALVPVLAAVMGVFWLGEPLTPFDAVAVVLASVGVALANGALQMRK